MKESSSLTLRQIPKRTPFPEKKENLLTRHRVSVYSVCAVWFLLAQRAIEAVKVVGVIRVGKITDGCCDPD